MTHTSLISGWLVIQIRVFTKDHTHIMVFSLRSRAFVSVHHHLPLHHWHHYRSQHVTCVRPSESFARYCSRPSYHGSLFLYTNGMWHQGNCWTDELTDNQWSYSTIIVLLMWSSASEILDMSNSWTLAVLPLWLAVDFQMKLMSLSTVACGTQQLPTSHLVTWLSYFLGACWMWL